MNQSTNATIQPLTPFQIVATSVFAVTSLTGLLAYGLVLIILFLYFSEFECNFYYIIISLSAADISYLALILFYVVPSTILQRHIWAPNEYLAGLLECLAYISQCTHLVFIGINRLAYALSTAVTPVKLNTIFLNKMMIAFWIILLWTLSACIAMPIKLIGCDLIYHWEVLDFMPDCRDRVSTSATHAATVADAVISGLLPVLVTALNVATWFTVYAKGKQTNHSGNPDERAQLVRRRKRERLILIQFTLISTMLLLFYASFWIFPTLLKGSAGSVVVTLFGIASAGVNPFTYLGFNKLMKKKAKYLILEKMLGRNGNHVSNTAVENKPATVGDRRRSTIQTHQ